MAKNHPNTRKPTYKPRRSEGEQHPSLNSLIVVTASGAQSISPANFLHSKEGQKAFISIVKARPELEQISVSSIPSVDVQVSE